MLSFDVRNFSNPQRETVAANVKTVEDFNLPTLDAWNYENCRQHKHGWDEEYYDKETDTDRVRKVTDRPKPGCRKCGILFRKHQRIAIAWIYLRKRGLIADPPGFGKTAIAGGLIAMLNQTGELHDVGKVVIVPRAPALMQWYDELLRMMPGLNVVVTTGTKKQRQNLYLQPWDVILVSPQTLVNDISSFEKFRLSTLITDDADALRNSGTKTAWALKRIGDRLDRMVVMTGSPMQKQLKELHSTLESLGGRQAFGSEDMFLKRHEFMERIAIRDPNNGLITGHKMVKAYKNLNEVKAKMAPMVLRRTLDDLDDVSMPEINPRDVFLEMYPKQRDKYAELQQGILTILKEQGTEVKHTTALTQLLYGAKICGGLATLGEPDGPLTSIKMDWTMQQLEEGGELEGEKVVLFIQFKDGIRAMQDRLRQAGIGFETVWGEEPDKMARRRSQERFWEDPHCKVLMGTQAIEQSLNLHVARHLINMDMILNPERMRQLAGRIRRDGSAYKHVFVHNLLTVNSQEERYLPLLEREAALGSFIWDESSELFNALDAMTLMRLITG